MHPDDPCFGLFAVDPEPDPTYGLPDEDAPQLFGPHAEPSRRTKFFLDLLMACVIVVIGAGAVAAVWMATRHASYEARP